MAPMAFRPACAQTSEPVSLQSSAYRQALERETFDLINKYRKAQDMPILQWDDTIAKVSRIHSKDMANEDSSISAVIRLLD